MSKAASNPNFSEWFNQLTFSKIENKVVYFNSSANMTYINFAKRQYSKYICDAFSKLGYNVSEIEIFKVDESTQNNIIDFNVVQKGDVEFQTKLEVKGKAVADKDVLSKTKIDRPRFKRNLKQEKSEKIRLKQIKQFRKEYTFGEFLEAPCNRFAYNAAKNISKMPGEEKHNPLVLHGKTGLGKTHLMQAIGREVLESHTADKVKFCSMDSFMMDVTEALSKNNLDEVIAKYISYDVLLIDDIQFLRGVELTKAFSRVFSDMISKKKQIVISCDVIPSDIRKRTVPEQEIYSRLLSRFESGLLLSIDAPSYETRVDLLKKKMESSSCEKACPDEVLNYLAENCYQSVRRLEGVLHIIQFYGTKINGGCEIDLAMVKEIITDTMRDNTCAVNIKRIMESVAEEFGFKVDLLSSKTRVKNVPLARQIAMYLCHHYTKNTDKTISVNFNRDHSTVSVSVKKIESLLKEDSDLLSCVNKIRGSLGLA